MTSFEEMITRRAKNLPWSAGIFLLMALAVLPLRARAQAAAAPPMQYDLSALAKDPCYKAAATAAQPNGKVGLQDCPDMAAPHGAAWAYGFKQAKPSAICYDIVSSANDSGFGFAEFLSSAEDFMKQQFSDTNCKYRSNALSNICGLAIQCFDGGSEGITVFPVAALSLVNLKLAGGVPAVFDQLGQLSVKVGLGFRVWEFNTFFEQHMYFLYAPNTTITTTGETSAATSTTNLYRFGLSVGIGALNGLVTADILWLNLIDGTTAQYKGGGLAFAFNIDLAAGAALGLAQLAPSK